MNNDPIVRGFAEICTAVSFAQAQHEITKAALGHGIRQVAQKLVLTVPRSGVINPGS